MENQSFQNTKRRLLVTQSL